MPVEIIDEIRSYSKQRASFREWAGYFLGVVSFVLLVVLATNAHAQVDRAAHIKAWASDVQKHAEASGAKFDWLIEDTGEDYMEGPVVRVTIPGKHFCLVGIHPTDHERSAMLGCAPLPLEDRKTGV
jgi:hypothetical protein